MAFGYAVYFAERANNRIVRWDPDSGATQVVAGEPPTPDPDQELRDPYGLAFDRDGHLLIADKLSSRICKLRSGRLESLVLTDPNGHRRKRPESPPHYTPELITPTGLYAEQSGTLLCTFHQDHTVYRIHLDGSVELLAGVVRNKPYHFLEAREQVPPAEVPSTPVNLPVSVVGRSDGTIFFIERGWQIVREYHPARGLRSVFPLGLRQRFESRTSAPAEAAIAEYHPARPGSLALDANGILYVTEIQHGCVLQVDFGAGRIRRVIESRSPGAPGGIEALAFGPDGTAWVLDAGAERLGAYEPIPAGPWNPMGVSLQVPMRAARPGGIGLVTGQ